jgi:hypothetical protein
VSAPAVVGPLSFLLGTWEGDGRGLWTGDGPPFEYRERVSLAGGERPFLTYHQSTWAADGKPLHTEAGYLRPVTEGSVEFVVAQPTGIVEVHAGAVREGRVELRSVRVEHAPTALNVTEVTRTMWVVGDELSYEVALAMNDEDLAPHLAGTLHRTT